MQNLENKTALITGGSKGIGYGIAAALMGQGMNVAITSRSQKSADEAADELNKSGKGKAIGIKADVRDFESQQKAVEAVMKKWGRLDLLVPNAGVRFFDKTEHSHFVP